MNREKERGGGWERNGETIVEGRFFFFSSFLISDLPNQTNTSVLSEFWLSKDKRRHRRKDSKRAENNQITFVYGVKTQVITKS